MSIEIVACLSLIDALAYNYLMPIVKHPLVSRLWIIRPQKINYGKIKKAIFCLAPSSSKIGRFFQMFRHCVRLVRRKEIRAFISFNPIPYGLITMFVARIYGKPLHFGFIGSDWYRDVKGPLGFVLLPFLRLANFFTVTGERMRKDMIFHGFESQKIVILPHSIDISRFHATSPTNKKYTFIFVGQLIKRKRVDLILKAFKQVLKQHPEVNLCIVGDGPLSDTLKNQAKKLGISREVTFTGYTTEVQKYLGKALIAVLASEMEGFPFALVEAMCSGLVPISTPVGTIPDLLINEKNGLLVPRDDTDSLAQAMSRLYIDDELYDRLRENILLNISHFSYEKATMIWDSWFRSISSK